jgi:hypothetical protein
MDEFIGYAFTANTTATSELPINKAKNIATVVVF